MSYFGIGWYPCDFYGNDCKLFGVWIGRRWFRIRPPYVWKNSERGEIKIGWDPWAGWAMFSLRLPGYKIKKLESLQGYSASTILNNKYWKFTVIDFQFLKFRFLIDLHFKYKQKMETKGKEKKNLVDMPVVDLGKIDLENTYV